MEQENIYLKPNHLLHKRYKIERFLEERHGANLYRAIDQITNLSVIVKEKLHAQDTKRTVNIDVPSTSGEILTSNPWYDEFAILRTVTYPTVVKAVDIFHEQNRSYLIIEQLEGRDLGYFLTKQKVTIQQASDWIIQICQSLSQIHRKKIVHLDLQPRYIIVTPDLERVRLTGFHRARQLPLNTPIDDYNLGYSAPELIEGNMWEIDQRADIYSLGMIWYQLLTGFDPSKQKNLESKYNLPELTYYFPNVHPELNRILKKMIAYDYNDRFSSIDEVKKAILELLSTTPIFAAFGTDVGLLREANEDSFFVQELEYLTQKQKDKLGLYIVADGMGGAEAGELASAIAVKTTSNYIIKVISDTKTNLENIDFKTILKDAILKANREIFDTAKRNPNYKGMGTTITAAIIYKGQIFIGHVGDSRGYLINQNYIERITKDHSLIQRLLDLGQITPQEATVHPQRNLIYRSLGAYPTVEVDIYERYFKHGDYLLLCSDGLVEHVSDNEIHKAILEMDNPWNICFKLINLANINGGSDNTTIIIVYRKPLDI